MQPHDATGDIEHLSVLLNNGICSHEKHDSLIATCLSPQSPPAVELLHLLNGVGAGQALRGRGSGGPLPRRGSVHVVHEEDPPVAVDPSLPV